MRVYQLIAGSYIPIRDKESLLTMFYRYFLLGKYDPKNLRKLKLKHEKYLFPFINPQNGSYNYVDFLLMIISKPYTIIAKRKDNTIFVRLLLTGTFKVDNRFQYFWGYFLHHF